MMNSEVFPIDSKKLSELDLCAHSLANVGCQILLSVNTFQAKANLRGLQSLQ